MKEEVVQCCMISIDDNEQEIDEVTLLSGQHLSLPQKEKLSQNEKDDASKGKVGNSSQPLSPRLSVSCLACIMFSDEDLQLGENFQLTEQSAVQMCSNNLLPEIATYIGTVEPQSFDALVSKANNVERQIARQKSTMQRGCNLEEKNTKGKKPRNNGEVMATFVNNGRQNGKGKEGLKNLTLEEKKKTKYSFHDDDVEGIFNELMKEKAIQLPEPKRPFEVDKIDDLKYCHYH